MMMMVDYNFERLFINYNNNNNIFTLKNFEQMLKQCIQTLKNEKKKKIRENIHITIETSFSLNTTEMYKFLFKNYHCNTRTSTIF